jgi:hypothetical protein
MSEDSEASSRDSMRRFQRGFGVFDGVGALAHHRQRGSERRGSVARGVERVGLHTTVATKKHPVQEAMRQVFGMGGSVHV